MLKRSTLLLVSVLLTGCPPAMDRPLRAGATCSSDEDCDDGIGCTTDRCNAVARTCRHIRGECPEGTVYSLAAADSSPEDKASADRVCTGSQDEKEIQAALFRLPADGTLLLAAGTFKLADEIGVPAQRKIVGQGDRTVLEGMPAARLPLLYLGDGNVKLIDFEMSGRLKVLNISSHIRLRNIVARNMAADVCRVFENYAAQRTISDIELRGCQVLGSAGHGFVNGGEGSPAGSYGVSDVRFIDCKAERCGETVSSCELPTGFALAEGGIRLADCEVTRCRAESSRHSGFRVAAGSEQQGVVLRECSSVDNGRGGDVDENAAGYAVSGDTKLHDCSSERNASGYFLFGESANANERPELHGCRDEGSREGLHLDEATHALVKDSVFKANTFGVWAQSSTNLVLQNVIVADPLGGNVSACGGTASCNVFGCSGQAIKDSQLELHICGCQQECALFAQDGTNLSFTGTVCPTGGTQPLCISGGSNVETSGVQLTAP